MAGTEETVAAVSFRETGQTSAAQPIFASPLQLGKKICHGRKQARLFGPTTKGVGPRIDQRCRRKYDPGGAFASLGEFASESFGYGDGGDQQKDRFKNFSRRVGAVPAPADHDPHVRYQSSATAQWRKKRNRFELNPLVRSL